MDLTEEIQDRKDQLQSILQKAEALRDVVEDKIEDSKIQSEQALSDIDKMKQQINTTVDEIVKKLYKKRNYIKMELDNVKKQKERLFSTVSNGHKVIKGGTTRLIADITNTLQKMNDQRDDVTLGHSEHRINGDNMKDLQTRLSSLQISRIPDFAWNLEESRNAHFIDTLQIAEVSSYINTSDSETVSEMDTFGETMGTIPLPELYGLVGMVVIDKTLLFLHAGHNYLYTHPIKSDHKPQKLSVQGLTSGGDMVRYPPEQSQIVISDCRYKLLHWVQLSQDCEGIWSIMSTTSTTVKYRPRGLGVKGNKLLVSDFKTIHVLHAGIEIERVSLPYSISPTKALGQITGSGYIISDQKNRQVVLVTDGGDIQQSYSGAPGFYPADIVCCNDSIYVSNPNYHRVEELDVNGFHMRQLLAQQDPRKVCVDDSGLLYVQQGSIREVMVIDTPKHAPEDIHVLTEQTKLELTVNWPVANEVESEKKIQFPQFPIMRF